MPSGMTPSFASSPSDWELIEPLCVAFEEAWRRGAHPLLHEYLHLGRDLPQPLLLEELLRIEMFYRQSAGETVAREDYKTRFVDAADVIDRVFASQPQLPHRSQFAPQALVGRYRILQQLGQGSFGVVYLSHDQELDREVAIKIAGNGRSATPEQMVRLLEEARAAARLRHPAIVAVYDVQPLADGGVFAVLEYIQGQPLSDLQQQPAAASDALRLFADIADAVGYAHTSGFVHRDLHPGNILIDERGAAHVADFGLAVHEDQQRARAGERAGSLFYMAPEQVRGETHRLDGRADIWAIGAMLYESLTGRHPFDGETSQQIADEILHRDPKPLRQIRADIPAELERICLRCLAKQPEDRFATAGDLANALRASGRRNRIWIPLPLVAAVALLLAGFACVWLLTRNDNTQVQAANDVGVELLIWKNDQWKDLESSGVLPLRPRDRLRIQGHSSQPRYLYLLWLDSRHSVTPVFPWLLADWRSEFTEKPRTAFSLPDGAPDETWSMEIPQSGYEMVLLLARPTPLPESVRLDSLLKDLPTLSDHPSLASGVRFDYQQLLTLGNSRDVNIKSTQRIGDPLLDLQRELNERLQPLFPEMECLVFPVLE